MSLAQRLLLSIAILTLVAMGAYGLAVREAWRSTEHQQFERSLKMASAQLNQDLVRELQDLPKRVELLCDQSPIVDSALIDLVAGSGRLEPGTRLFRIAPLERVWLEAELYEAELALVHVGQSAKVTLPYLPGRVIDGTVSYVYPYLDGDTRTARIRVELPNPDRSLRPDMYADVDLRVDAGIRLTVPTSAVLFAGRRQFVFRDLGGGRFRPQQVELGIRGSEQVEVLSGLSAGDRVVTSGTFLIASESRLRSAMENW